MCFVSCVLVCLFVGFDVIVFCFVFCWFILIITYENIPLFIREVTAEICEAIYRMALFMKCLINTNTLSMDNQIVITHAL